MRRQKSPSALSNITPDSFGWGSARLSSLSHSSFSFSPQNADLDQNLVGLGDRKWSPRDTVSLVGQYAAHAAFLQFAGISDGAFLMEEWRVAQRRGVDAQLIRVGARRSLADEAAMPLTLIDEFAAAIGASGFHSLSGSWAAPEAVFAEACEKLHAVTTHRESLEASGVGQVLSPGEEALARLMTAGIVLYDDEDARTTLEQFVRLANPVGRNVIEVGIGASPIQPLSAWPADVKTGRSEEEVLDSLIDRLIDPVTVVVRDWNRFDAASRRVTLEFIRSAAHHSFLLPRACGFESTQLDAEPTRTFVAAPSLRSRAAIAEELRSLTGEQQRSWLQESRKAGFLGRLFLTGQIPPLEPSAALRDPMRSYAAALAVVGSGMSKEAADAILEILGGAATLEDLVRLGIVSVSAESKVKFESEARRGSLAATVPTESLRLIAASAIPILSRTGDAALAARLALEAGDSQTALPLVEKVDFDSAADDLLDIVTTRIPLEKLSPDTAARAATTFLHRGRYIDARRVGEAIGGEPGALFAALADRRCGAYASAVDRLVSEEFRSFDTALLRAELHRLTGRLDVSASELDRACSLAQSDLDAVRAAYEKALLSIDAEEPPATGWIEQSDATAPYYAARFRSYAADAEHNYAAAVRYARAAIAASADLAQKIDAALDLVYALFMAGDWDAARREARTALSLVEQTQGDRAAAGVLFTLGFLSADAGQFPQARAEIARLHRFFEARQDVRREREVELLQGQLALCEWRLDDAATAAANVVEAHVSVDVREAANLILDEIDWIRGTMSVLRSSEIADCAELRDRARLARRRFENERQEKIVNPVLASIQDWELDPLKEPPRFERRGDRLKLLRSMAGVWQISRDDVLRKKIHEIAAELQIVVNLDRRRESTPDVDVLRAAATRPYPFDESTFAGVPWQFVSKNRLGRWSQIGCITTTGEFDYLFDAIHRDWIRCGERSFLYIEGLDSWPEESRHAVASLFSLRAEHYNLKRAMEEPATAAPSQGQLGIVGDTPPIRTLRARIELVAKTDAPICIEGESGTGKELVARAIHQQSERRSKKFTAINCAALPETLIESELFGAARGAYTGADRDRAGLIEQSDGGTLFLDEIGELPLPSQAKLLRFLQEGEFRRVGDATLRTADVRVVTATNRDLESAVERGTFRQDLYYRIRVVELAVPALRERGADILILARHFLEQERSANRRGANRFSEEVESVFLSYTWPGNVRELQNSVRAACALAADSREIQLEHLPSRLQIVPAKQARTGSLNDEITNFRRLLIERSLRETGGNQNQAAKLLGVTRQALAYQIRELGILVKG